MDLALISPNTVGVLHLFAGFLIILTIYSSFLGFTYWISKDE